MRAAYIQSVGGASGDMLLGALLDAGVPLDTIEKVIDALGLTGVSVATKPGVRCEVRGTRALVDVSAAKRYSPQQMLDTVSHAAGLSEGVRSQATGALNALFDAEARVHGHDRAAVHLDELGTADTLVDVVGVAAGLEYLAVERVYASPLVLGEATGPRRPGGYSNPAPATLEIIAASKAPIAPDRPIYAGVGELTTPTGAALIATLAQFRQPAMALDRIGVGIGGKDPAAFPNVVRLWLGDTAGADLRPEPGGVGQPPLARWQDNVILLETNLDDATGEQIGFAMEQLFEAGALDVWYTPIQMKKNRPGVVLSAMAPASLESELAEAFLRHTPTLGVRVRPVGRYVAERDVVTVETEYGPIRVKRKWLGGELVSQSPEYEDVARAAREWGVSIREIVSTVRIYY